MQRSKISIICGQEAETIRIEGGMSMRKIISRFFERLSCSQGKYVPSAAMAEPDTSTDPEGTTRYKWWGDDRYDPI